MTKNTLGDLNNHLFAELERLGDEDLIGDELREEIKRAAAIANISKNVIANASVILAAAKLKEVEFCRDDEVLPKMLNG